MRKYDRQNIDLGRFRVIFYFQDQDQNQYIFFIFPYSRSGCGKVTSSCIATNVRKNRRCFGSIFFHVMILPLSLDTSAILIITFMNKLNFKYGTNKMNLGRGMGEFISAFYLREFATSTMNNG